MALLTVTGADTRLDTVGELIEGFCDWLIASNNWVDDFEYGVHGDEIYERWVSRLAANTVNGDTMRFGIRKNEIVPGIGGNGVRRSMEIMSSKNVASFNNDVRENINITGITQAANAVITTTSAHSFATGDHVRCVSVAGMTEINDLDLTIISTTSDTLTVSTSSTGFSVYTGSGSVALTWDWYRGCPQEEGRDHTAPASVNNMTLEDGGAGLEPYVRAWFMTPVDVGAAPADEQYAYCVVETDDGQYVTFGFGELIKKGTWSGGVFYLGHWWDETQGASSDNNYCAFASSSSSGNTNAGNGQGGHNCVQVTATWNGVDPSVKTGDNNNGWITADYSSRASASSAWSQGRPGGLLPSWTIVGGNQLQHSPAPFSGQAFRSPITWWAHVTSERGNGNGDFESDVVPLGEIPDVFAGNIRDLDPGTTKVDDTEDFLVVPVKSKEAALPSSGNWGFFIRNPAL